MRNLVAAFLVAGLFAQAQIIVNSVPTKQFGHPRLEIPPKSAAPNLVEGREFFGPQGIAFDTSGTTTILYVFDTNNHRVLAFRDPASFINGEKADLVIGQRDMFSTLAQGPGSSAPNPLSAGFRFPIGGVVDAQGNLYVIDSGNNRILRFAKPFEQSTEILIADLVIGQASSSNGTQANQGNTNASATTLDLTSGSNPLLAGAAFDASGNLWVTDAGNNRVLRYPASELTPFNSLPEANLALGQINLGSNNPPTFPNNAQDNPSTMLQPADLAFDSAGGLYVADGQARVMYWASPSGTGVPATRILGIQPVVQGQPTPPRPTQYTLGGQNAQPTCVYTLGLVVFVCDSSFNRIVRYDPPGSWPAATPTNPSPPQAQVYGQAAFTFGDPNRGLSHAQANSFRNPSRGVFLNGEMWVADTGNHRVLAYPSSSGFAYENAHRVLGQVGMDLNAINLVEGRELFLAASNTTRGAGIVVDTTSVPNHVYVADYLNNRVLGFRDSRQVGGDARTLLNSTADLYIGQPDQFHSDVNYPNADPLQPSQQGLFGPVGLAIDAEGNLYVADSGNSRVLRFPKPFDQASTVTQSADLVLGQPSFLSQITDASNFTMSRPTGVVVFNNGGVAVSDADHNRILIFRKNGDFTNGQAAAEVIGQPNFSSTSAGSGNFGLNSPRGMAVDTSDRLYVADTNNNRMVVFGNTTFTPTFGLELTGLNRPEAVAVSRATGHVWVANTNSNRVRRYREFIGLQANPNFLQEIASNGPLAIAIDAFDNLIVAENTNRILFYFPVMLSRHGANFTADQGVAPGQILALYRPQQNLDLEPVANPGAPYPKTLSGLEVLVNGTPAPIFRVDAAVIYIIVPWNAPINGFAEFVIQRPETGEVLATNYLEMRPSVPGFFTAMANGIGQVAATNYNNDGSTGINSAANPVDATGAISFWLTGQGAVQNQPPDGEADLANLSPTTVLPQVLINGSIVPSQNIAYSGLSPEFPGLWQLVIDLTPDMQLPPSTESNQIPISIIVIMNDVGSNFVGNPNGGADLRMFTQITGTFFYVK